MSLSAILQALVDAGATPEMLLAAVKADEAARAQEDEIRREKARNKKRRQRSSVPGTTGDKEGQKGTDGDTPEAKVSPKPPSKTQTPISPTTDPKGSFVAPKGQALEAAFAVFWSAYPKRGNAPNPRKPAFDSYCRKVRIGADPDEILAGARAYAGQCVANGKAGSELVAQAVTWLNQERWRDYAQAELLPEEGKRAPPPGAPSDEELRARYGAMQ